VVERKEAAVFSDQYVSSWQLYAADHTLTFRFSAGSYPASPVTGTKKLLRDGKCLQDYKDSATHGYMLRVIYFLNDKLYKKWNSYHPLHETLQIRKDYHTPPVRQIRLRWIFFPTTDHFISSMGINIFEKMW
jgi:hypothetical protein